MLAVDSVLFTPHSQRDAALAARSKFTSADGDHMMLLNIYRAYKAAKGNKVPRPHPLGGHTPTHESMQQVNELSPPPGVVP